MRRIKIMMMEIMMKIAKKNLNFNRLLNPKFLFLQKYRHLFHNSKNLIRQQWTKFKSKKIKKRLSLLKCIWHNKSLIYSNLKINFLLNMFNQFNNKVNLSIVLLKFKVNNLLTLYLLKKDNQSKIKRLECLSNNKINHLKTKIL